MLDQYCTNVAGYKGVLSMKTRKKSLRGNRGPAATLEAAVGGSDIRKRETCGLSSSPAMEEELPFAGCDIPEIVSATASPETVEKELPDPTRQQAASFTKLMIIPNQYNIRYPTGAKFCTASGVLPDVDSSWAT